MAGPDDPTIPYRPSDEPGDGPGDEPSDRPSDRPQDPTPSSEPPPTGIPPGESPSEPPPVDPGDPTLVYGAPPVVPGSLPDEGAFPPPPPPLPPPPPPGGLPPEPPDAMDEPEGWWAQRTIGERWAIAAGIILLGILIAVLFLPGDEDDDLPVGSTTTILPGATSTTSGETTTTTGGETTTTTGGETTTTTGGETTTTTGGDTTTSTTSGGDTTTTTTPSTTSTTEPLPEFPSVEGTGPDTVDFSTPDDLGAAVEVTHDGTGPFVVRALDAEGDEIAVLIERLGAYAGTVGVNLDSDHEPIAALEFIADGDWLAEATYIGDVEPATLGGASGGSDEAMRLEPASVSDEEFGFSHDGSREFVVIAYSADGNASDVINALGEFAGTGVVPAGTAVVTIQGDGNWTITSG